MDASSRSRRLATVAVALVGAIWAGAFVSAVGYRDRPPSAEEAAIAMHLVRGHGFRSPMDPSPAAPPSAWSPPIYPLAIAASYRLFGVESAAALTALALINVAAFGAAAAAAFRIGGALGRSPAGGLAAAGLFLIHPAFLISAGDFWDGMLSLAIFLWLVAFAAERRCGGGAPAARRDASLLGLGMAALLLTNASYLPACVVLVWTAFRRWSAPWRRRALTCIVALVAIAPWTIRNYSAFGTFVGLRTGLAIQLWLGNAPESDGWLDERAYALHPIVNADERAMLLAMGEPAYNALAFQRFRQANVVLWPRYLANCLRRAWYLIAGGAPAQPVAVLLANVALGGAGCAGAIVVWRRRGRVLPYALLLAAVAAPFVATAVIDRYALPLRALLAISAGAGAAVVAGGRRATGASDNPRAIES